MSSKLTTLGIVLIATLISSAAIAEEAPSLGFDLSADYVSKYIWRGQNLQDDGAFQPSVNMTYGKFSANIWASMELSDINGNAQNFTEIDYSLDYSDDLPGVEGVSYSVGLINYVFPNTKLEDTVELYAGLSFDCFLSPSVTWYADINEAKGSYVSFGVGHTFDNVIGEVPADVSASFGWGNSTYNDFYWGVKDSAMNDFALSVAFPIELQSGWSLTPSINYVTLMDGDIKKTDLYSTDDSYVYFGVSLAKSF